MNGSMGYLIRDPIHEVHNRTNYEWTDTHDCPRRYRVRTGVGVPFYPLSHVYLIGIELISFRFYEITHKGNSKYSCEVLKS